MDTVINILCFSVKIYIIKFQVLTKILAAHISLHQSLRQNLSLKLQKAGTNISKTSCEKVWTFYLLLISSFD